MKRILIMATERSGTNMLRSMLDAHPLLVAPPAIHYTHGFRHAFKYGDIRQSEAFESMADDVLRLSRTHPVRWCSDELDGASLAARATHRSLWGLVDALLTHHAASYGASGWAIKDNQLHEHVFAIRGALEDVHVLLLVRDPRAVVASMLLAPLHPKHELVAANLWTREQEAALRAHQQLCVEGASTVLRYEDLVSHPAATAERICQEVGIPFDEQMLAFGKGDRATAMSQASGYWKNLTKPVNTDSLHRYRQSLSDSQIRNIESIAHPVMESLGYARSLPGRRLRYLRMAWAKVASEVRQQLARRSGAGHVKERRAVVRRWRAETKAGVRWDGTGINGAD